MKAVCSYCQKGAGAVEAGELASHGICAACWSHGPEVLDEIARLHQVARDAGVPVQEGWLIVTPDAVLISPHAVAVLLRAGVSPLATPMLTMAFRFAAAHTLYACNLALAALAREAG